MSTTEKAIIAAGLGILGYVFWATYTRKLDAGYEVYNTAGNPSNTNSNSGRTPRDALYSNANYTGALE